MVLKDNVIATPICVMIFYRQSLQAASFAFCRQRMESINLSCVERLLTKNISVAFQSKPCLQSANDTFKTAHTKTFD
jgi:hypothetical protein